jgi:hypothetical protein
MWKNSKFVLIFLAELVLIFQITLPYKYLHFHCNHTGPGTTEKHGDLPNEANRHCHAPGNLIHKLPVKAGKAKLHQKFNIYL